MGTQLFLCALSKYYNPILLCFPSCPLCLMFTPNGGPFPRVKTLLKCVEASFFTLPLGLCCQRAALRKSLFLPGRASCVPPPSPSVLMAVPPTCWDPDPSRGRASAGDNYCCSPALIIWPHGSITADHMFQQTRRGRSKGEKRGRVRIGREEEKKSSFHFSPKFHFSGEALARMVKSVFQRAPLMVIIYLDQGNHTYYRLCLAPIKFSFNLPLFFFASAAESEAIWGSPCKKWVLSLLVLSAKLSRGQLGSVVVFWALLGFFAT